MRKLVAEHNLDAAAIPATGKDGRLVKADVLAFIEKGGGGAAPAPAAGTGGRTRRIGGACGSGGVPSTRRARPAHARSVFP